MPKVLSLASSWGRWAILLSLPQPDASFYKAGRNSRSLGVPIPLLMGSKAGSEWDLLDTIVAGTSFHQDARKSVFMKIWKETNKQQASGGTGWENSSLAWTSKCCHYSNTSSCEQAWCTGWSFGLCKQLAVFSPLRSGEFLTGKQYISVTNASLLP